MPLRRIIDKSIPLERLNLSQATNEARFLNS